MPTNSRCPSCSLDLAAAWCASAHRTADGVVRYLRCPCGTWTIVQVREVAQAVVAGALAFHDPQ